MDVGTITVCAVKMELPAPYVARPYGGQPDHAAMASILTDYRQHGGNPEMSTAEQFDVDYANLTNCDVATDIVVIEVPTGSLSATCGRVGRSSRTGPVTTCCSHRFDRHTWPSHCSRRSWRPRKPPAPDGRWHPQRPVPGVLAAPRAWSRTTGEAAWLEALGYRAVRFTASLQRPDLENIPDRQLPDGVEIRPVTPEMIRPILEAHHENFRDDWDFTEATEEDFRGCSTIHFSIHRCGRSPGSATPWSDR